MKFFNAELYHPLFHHSNGERSELWLFLRIHGTEQFGKIAKTADQAEYDDG
jgi:hypothetical protein